MAGGLRPPVCLYQKEKTMKLIDLKRSEDTEGEIQGESGGAPIAYEQDQYPVCIYLDDDSLEKLSISNLEVGKEMMIQAKVRVKSFASYETTEGKELRAELCVLAMGLDVSGKSAAQVLYGPKDTE
jgi:hypothetical protein